MSERPDREDPEQQAGVPQPLNHDEEAPPPTAIIRELSQIVAHKGPQEPRYHPLFDKLEPQHLTKLLEVVREGLAARMRAQRERIWFRFIYMSIPFAIFIFLTLYLLPDHSDLYLEILKVLGASALGAVGGYGFKAYQEQQRD